ncbi:unnamed protein product [Rotaria sp. Silwood2]|nr:unnamed protein product [Rotaria sp. Silwood2]CAF3032284.1 unnamed protein product [Rotaria sp. Silwood2]CAF3507355.1 unnamed protein product [Rotaria sp. Silwood2]CAF4115202.1 unnamed protein product [Rotaria sp. Silwood2]CAF4580858.1 unnamed protein product [Rotaria sp. Silwood2]
MNKLFLLLQLMCPAVPWVTVYHTLETFDQQAHTCFYYTNLKSGIQSVPYCIQSTAFLLNNSSTIASNCSDAGTQYSFYELFQLGYDVTHLLQWHAPIDDAEKYAVYLNDHPNNESNLNDNFICNCSHPTVFGHSCEYQLYAGETIPEAIKQQFSERVKHRMGTQIHGRRSCYTTIDQCDSGLLCLEWRQVCDGIQNCMYGLDEENCHKLEYNECEDDEYRCGNGMCIPGEYFVDGK